MVDELEGLIECKNLTFTYPDAQNPSLENISFTIRPKEKIGIIGKTGCGKTTLVDLLTRIYNVDEGCLYIDGIDIMQLPIQKVRDLISYVPQDNFLFNDTILNNITLYQEIDSNKWLDICKMTYVDDFVKKSSIVYYSREALRKIHKDIEQFATSEQLTAHANSIAVRFEDEEQ